MAQKRKRMVDILMDIVGGILIALGTYNFAAAAKFPMVGLNGIALIFYHLLGTPIGLVAMLLNVPIAIACFKILGRRFFLRSLRTILITSVIMDYIAPMFPVYEGDRMLAAVCTGVFSGLGFALIYMRNSSTGGMDFIIMSVKAKNPHLSLGKISFAADMLVVLIGVVMVSRDMDSLIYGAIVSYLLSIVVDKVMYGVDSGKMALIVTDYPKKVAEQIDLLTGRGATYLKAEGSYSREEKDVVMCACNNKQMFTIRSAVKEIDQKAFVIILESNEVLGEGFKPH
ncbi:MAG: YitT family protein [Lachnospiraceae bacterium]|nr:YitT family protein [Candidatus Fimimorpha excrementavium]